VGIITAVFGSASAAEGARLELLSGGVAEQRIRLMASPQIDPIAGEYPGQPFANQPGQADRPPGDHARSHPTCSLEVEVGSPAEAERTVAVLDKHGGRRDV